MPKIYRVTETDSGGRRFSDSYYVRAESTDAAIDKLTTAVKKFLFKHRLANSDGHDRIYDSPRHLGDDVIVDASFVSADFVNRELQALDVTAVVRVVATNHRENDAVEDHSEVMQGLIRWSKENA